MKREGGKMLGLITVKTHLQILKVEMDKLRQEISYWKFEAEVWKELYEKLLREIKK